MRILVIDDDVQIGRILRKYLEHLDHQVDYCTDAVSGLIDAKHGEYDLIISDIRMPEMDGLELLEKLTSHDRNCKVILITGYAEIDVVEEALNRGAYGFFQKPFDMEKIGRKVKKLAWENRQRNLYECWQANNIIGVMETLHDMQLRVGKVKSQTEIFDE